MRIYEAFQLISGGLAKPRHPAGHRWDLFFFVGISLEVSEAVLEEPSKCTEVDLPLDGLEGACLRLEVASKEKRRVT